MTAIGVGDEDGDRRGAIREDDRREAEMDPSDVYPPAEGTFEAPARRAGGMPTLSSEESAVLAALSAEGGGLTIGALRARTGYPPKDLRPLLGALRAKGLVTRLNTVVESYASRFPGLNVEAD